MLPSYHPYCHQAALSSEWYGTELPSFLAKIEACVVDMAGAGAAHAVGGGLLTLTLTPNSNLSPNPSPNPSSTPNQVGGGVSYADVCIWSLLREGSEEDLALVAEVSQSVS